jgi:hypothetical protein
LRILFIKKFINAVLNKLFLSPSIQEKEYIYELRTTFRKIPPFESTNELLPDMVWLSHMNVLQENILNRDPRRFLRWNVILRTMFAGNESYISTELKYLKNCLDWNMRWTSAIEESSVGHPVLYPFYPKSSGNLIHHAYHVAQFEEKTGIKVHNMNYVFEFGGGYGSMCRLLFNLGFKGKYIIFDLPPFSALQRYFLKNIGLPVLSSNTFNKQETGILCLSDVRELKDLLAEHKEKSNSIFITTWSISESPISIRELILPQIIDFSSFLIAYQDRFGGINNLDYFKNWQDTYKVVTWYSSKIEHLPGNNYLFGINFNNITNDFYDRRQ